MDGIPCGADNGLGSSWESNLRVPAIAKWPGHIAPGVVSRELVSTVDIFVTVLALARISLQTDRTYDGVDISAVLFDHHMGLNGQSDSRVAPAQPRCLFHWRNFHDAVPTTKLVLAAVRCGHYKAHLATASALGPDPTVHHQPWLLFNVFADPEERAPLTAGLGSHTAGVLAEMQKAVTKHLQGLAWSYGDDGLTTAQNTSFALCCDRARGCHCA
jgi:arylsulfatase A-like enzyme